MAIRLYYDKKASLVGKTVYFAPGKRLAKDRELVEREYHAGDHTVDREQLLDGTPCVVTAQTPNAAFVFVSWQSISGLQFSARLPLRFFRDTLSEYPYRDIYAKAKRDAVLAKLKAEQAAAARAQRERARAIAAACAIVVARAKAMAKVAKLQKKLKKALRSLASWSTVAELKAKLAKAEKKLAKAEKKLAKLGGGGAFARSADGGPPARATASTPPTRVALLSRCSVGQLKQEIAARGLSAAGAIEKSDLIRLLEQPVRYVRRSIPQQR